MIRIIGSAALAALQAKADAAQADAEAAQARAAAAQADAARHRDNATAAASTIGKLRAALARAEGELAVLRAQAHLDAEDRVVLRKLLSTARKQTTARNEVAVLLRHGELHSVHATQQAAEAAAVADGAPPQGWVSVAAGTPLPPAADVPWRVTVLPVHTER
ncbi:hypothetical protein ACFOOM_01140 [Streptomyces echinoruber]|uniref:Uncharacterized protein n=1 Tax=Streptomyces echinoruber TaxID=68898 RepID=A0A918QUK7_9ACTN|nr:hypothetical protein [Streptomyces echinoruber]GGZ73023.1 hypothetical protein GCM10010389_08050 [Streptomyces echinoruber]